MQQKTINTNTELQFNIFWRTHPVFFFFFVAARLALAFNNHLSTCGSWKPRLAIWYRYPPVPPSVPLFGTLTSLPGPLRDRDGDLKRMFVRSTNELWFFLPSAGPEWSDCKSMRLASIKCHKRHNKPSVSPSVLQSSSPPSGRSLTLFSSLRLSWAPAFDTLSSGSSGRSSRLIGATQLATFLAWSLMVWYAMVWYSMVVPALVYRWLHVQHRYTHRLPTSIGLLFPPTSD